MTMALPFRGWLNVQRSVDLWKAAQSVKEEVDRIKPLHAALPGRAPDTKTSFPLVLPPVMAGVLCIK